MLLQTLGASVECVHSAKRTAQSFLPIDVHESVRDLARRFKKLNKAGIGKSSRWQFIN